MTDLSEHLLELADRLDKLGHLHCADAIDGLIKEASVQKVAQYVGVIGYVLKQNRAVGNCIRKKRVASNRPMQEVVLECLKEYQDGQKYFDTEWTSKYAQCVQEDPTGFDQSHLHFLATIGAENNIEHHLGNLRLACKMLHDNQIEDEILDKVLSHAETLGNILRKDAETSRPFKLAAPRLPSRRNRWQQFFNPTEKSWNPFSWFRNRRERGEDEETLTELAVVADGLHDISLIAQRMSTSIFRLKNQVLGYLSGSAENLGDSPTAPDQLKQEDRSVVDKAVQLINNIDPKNWNASILAVHQLKWLTTNYSMKNPYNQSSFEKAGKLADDLAGNIEVIYDKLEQMQDAMSTLGRRLPIIGTDPDPKYSPLEEFGVLERILDKIYKNPFDDESHYEAKRAYARLHRKLRYAENTPEPPGGTTQPGSPSPANPSAPPTAPATSSTTQFDQNKIDTISNNLLSELNQSGITVDAFAQALDTILLSMGETVSPEGKNVLQQVLDKVRASTTSGSTGQAPTPQAIETPDDRINQALDSSRNLFGDDDENDADRPLNLAQNNPDNFGIILKIADILDKVDSNLADLLDDHIREMNEDIPLPNPPPYASVIKEKKGVAAVSR